MVIKSIGLYNFRQFKGNQEIEFSIDKEKNVTVILGINTSGKTTLVQAFNWCLYGKCDYQQKELLNKEIAQQDGETEVRVNIILVHEGREYLIIRRQLFRCISGSVNKQAAELSVSYKEPNGEMQAVIDSRCEEVINNILPSDLSNYFFFDGERIKNLTKIGGVKDAVRSLMGLEVLSSSMEHLDPEKPYSVYTKFNRELDVKKDNDSDSKRSRVEKLQEKIESAKENLDTLNNEKEYYANRKADLEKRIRENENVGRLQKERDGITRDIYFLTKQIERDDINIKTVFNGNAVSFFAMPLIANALKVIEEAKDLHEGIPQMHADSIAYILKRGYCLCGCDLTRNEGARDSLTKEQKLLPPEAIGTYIYNFKKDLLSNSNKSESYADDLSRVHTSWLENKYQLSEKQERLEQISSTLKGHENVAKLEEDYREVERKLNDATNRIIDVNEQVAADKREIELLNKEIDALAVGSDKNTRIRKYLDYTNALYQWFSNEYKLKLTNVKEQLLESINKSFSLIYHGNRRIEMSDNYNITSVTTGDSWALDTSNGLETVINFSFIMGLIDIARRRVKNKDEDESITSEPYPIVMDAPFSNLDKTHCNNIAKQLPEIAEQVIMIVMDKDWEIVEDRFQSRLGQKYIIEKQGKDTHSIISKEVL
jgi:DNA sulfur modification protein DndD